MKKFILLIILLLPINLFAPIKHLKHLNFLEEEYFLQKRIERLQDNSIKTRQEVFTLAQESIEIYLTRGNYKQFFPYMQDSISYALACIFVSESSNRLGQSAKSSLWITHNNPFGLTSSRGVTLKSWEMINNKRVIMNRTFKQFDSFELSIKSLIEDYLFKKNFTNVRNSYTVKEFLDSLYKGNYMTNKNWPNWAYNSIYLKYK